MIPLAREKSLLDRQGEIRVCFVNVDRKNGSSPEGEKGNMGFQNGVSFIT
jgi:hypothetical protein